MKAGRFTEAQIITILREAETGQTTRGVVPQAYYWGSHLLPLA
ncbi:MAG TPA: hypothetical protein VGD58_18975 [Herpetosiphonaceae bacterium]